MGSLQIPKVGVGDGAPYGPVSVTLEATLTWAVVVGVVPALGRVRNIESGSGNMRIKLQ